MSGLTGHSDQKPRRRRWTVAAVVGTYVVLLLLLVAIGRHVSLPDEGRGLAADAGPMNAALQQTMARPVQSDFLVDYASARALRDGVDPYAVSEGLIDRVDAPAWPVRTANPHPPTTLVLVLPFTFLPYQDALAAWSLAMIFVFIGTLVLLEVPLLPALSVGLGLAITFPGAYGIGNVVPLIGLGIAMAYRYRDRPALAALGITLAAAPKTSGLLLLIPFALLLRWRVVAWTVGFMACLAAVPAALYRRTWQHYLDAGTEAIRLNAKRPDNASLLNLAAKAGVPSALAVAFLVVAACLVAFAVRDSFWPSAWLMVAALPIAWAYSMLTLLPLAVVVIRARSRWALALVIASTAMLVGMPPLGYWPTRLVPIIVVVMGLSLLRTDTERFWPDAMPWRREPMTMPLLMRDQGRCDDAPDAMGNVI
jgi:hypothetical protein